MNTEIIKKLSLKETDKTFGLTFINNIVVYLFDKDIYCVDANTCGEPEYNGIIMFFCATNYVKITQKLIFELPENELRQYIKTWL
jgi:hypothetical protein